MDEILQKTYSKFKNFILFIKKFVDDTFLIIHKSKLQDILDSLNSYHPRLQFTFETEQNSKLNFLDVTVIRENQNLFTNWNLKETSANRILHWLSCHPKFQKINVMNNFISRILNLSSHQFWNQQIEFIKSTLLQHNYPKNLIQNSIETISNKIKNNSTNNIASLTTNNNNISHLNTQQSNTNIQTLNNLKIYKSLTYVPSISEKISNIFKKELPTITFGFSIKNKSKNIIYTKLKDKLTIDEKTDFIYKIPCDKTQNCNLTYYGQTERTLNKRIYEHRQDIRLKKQTTGLSQHCLHMNHTPDFDNAKILHRQNTQSKRLITESIYINSNTHHMNLLHHAKIINTSYLETLKYLNIQN